MSVETVFKQDIHEHDACAVGVFANISGRPSNLPLKYALRACATTIHREGISINGKMSDGVGILTQIPHKFFAEAFKEITGTAPTDNLAVGMFFLPQRDIEKRLACEAVIVKTLEQAGYNSSVWRDVPLKPDILGPEGAETCPAIKQLLIPKKEGVSDAQMERDLYIARRLIEKEIQTQNLVGGGNEEFYVSSLSSKTIIYKYMALATDIAEFYPDLADEKYETAVALPHSRFSTNTLTKPSRVQPFRYLAHNGEINTVAGNRNTVPLHAKRLQKKLGDGFDSIMPVIEPGRSDSGDADATLEMYKLAGYSLPAIKLMMVPEAFAANPDLSASVKELYQYLDVVYEAWDGPATLMISDGDMALIGGDRNGLRPVRYGVTTDGMLVAGSEEGMVDFIDPMSFIELGNLEPGAMMAVDLKGGKLLRDAELKEIVAKEFKDERKLLRNLQIVKPQKKSYNYTYSSKNDPDGSLLRARQRLAGYTTEDLKDIIDPGVRLGKEAIGAMGDDTPLHVLSEKSFEIYRAFYQKFAQVTNPPKDSIRERDGMSLSTTLGSFYNADGTLNAHKPLHLDTVILSNSYFESVKKKFKNNYVEIDCTFDPATGSDALENALARIRIEGAVAAAQGRHIILTDERAGENCAAVPMVLASAGVHSTLMQNGTRAQTSINVRSAECNEVHHIACLIGMGADTVNPYLAEESIVARQRDGFYINAKLHENPNVEKCLANHYKSLEDSLLKIMAKMGVCTVSSYRMARLFECIGISQDVVNEFMPGVNSRLEGLTLENIQMRLAKHHSRSMKRAGKSTLSPGGRLTNLEDGEDHIGDPFAIAKLQKSVQYGGDQGQAYFDEYIGMLNNKAMAKPSRLRHLLDIEQNPIPIEDVESVESILQRFMSGGISMGAIGEEAHDAIAQAMNQLNALSNCGEGGGNSKNYGTIRDHKVKQYATGHFGATADYFGARSTQQIEIKMAQGAKPGEGGQLMGEKVYGKVAEWRKCKEGTTLISPPPHHDSYSIEDHAQQIYDLKQINPKARVRTKLVSTTDIGPIVSGVAKCDADVIHIAGGDGGTGAAPISSLFYAGLPFEIGLTEANRALTETGLRKRVRLSTDGGLKTGRDILVANLMGAEEWSVGTVLMEAMGCLLMRQCQSNKCAVGIATQDPKLRKHFPVLDGKVKTQEQAVEMIKNFMLYLAHDYRQELARAGFRTVNEAVGRVDRLKQVRGQHLNLDLSHILQSPHGGKKPLHCMLENGKRNEPAHPKYPNRLTLDAALLENHGRDILSGRPCSFELKVSNENRALGTMIAGELVRTFNHVALPPHTLQLHYTGKAGQSFGAFAVQGMTMTLEGGANDFVGKGLTGGELIIFPKKNSFISKNTSANIIVGNVCFLGGDSGQAFIAGQAGNRFAVRNSGVQIVLEGMQADGCNYMTGGRVTSLAKTGKNFGSGMTGGEAFIYDPALQKKLHSDVKIIPMDENAAALLKADVENHYAKTGSLHAFNILNDWENAAKNFRHVVPSQPVKSIELTPQFAIG